MQLGVPQFKANAMVEAPRLRFLFVHFYFSVFLIYEYFKINRVPFYCADIIKRIHFLWHCILVQLAL